MELCCSASLVAYKRVKSFSLYFSFHRCENDNNIVFREIFVIKTNVNSANLLKLNKNLQKMMKRPI